MNRTQQSLLLDFRQGNRTRNCNAKTVEPGWLLQLLRRHRHFNSGFCQLAGLQLVGLGPSGLELQSRDDLVCREPLPALWVLKRMSVRRLNLRSCIRFAVPRRISRLLAAPIGSSRGVQCHDHAQAHGTDFPQPLTWLRVWRLLVQHNPGPQKSQRKEEVCRGSLRFEAKHLTVNLVL